MIDYVIQSLFNVQYSITNEPRPAQLIGRGTTRYTLVNTLALGYGVLPSRSQRGPTQMWSAIFNTLQQPPPEHTIHQSTRPNVLDFDMHEC